MDRFRDLTQSCVAILAINATSESGPQFCLWQFSFARLVLTQSGSYIT